jgi:cardiolipin synthase
MIGGNATTVAGDYLNSIKAIADDIDLARDYVHMEYFILVHDDSTRPVFECAVSLQ